MATRENHKVTTGTQREDRLMLPYQLACRRPGYPGEGEPDLRLRIPALAYDGENTDPRYVEAVVNFNAAELDQFIGQLTGMRNWMTEPFRDYDADMAVLITAGLFEITSRAASDAPAYYRRLYGNPTGQLFSAEQAVDFYEKDDDEPSIGELRDEQESENN